MILFQNLFFYYYFCQQVIFYLIHSSCRLIFVLLVQKITFGHTVLQQKKIMEKEENKMNSTRLLHLRRKTLNLKLEMLKKMLNLWNFWLVNKKFMWTREVVVDDELNFEAANQPNNVCFEQAVDFTIPSFIQSLKGKRFRPSSYFLKKWSQACS